MNNSGSSGSITIQDPSNAYDISRINAAKQQLKQMNRGDIVPSGYKVGQVNKFTPETMQLFQSLFPHLGEGSFLQKLAGGDEEMFKQLEAPAHRQFAGKLGDISSRFSGMGMGGRKGSGFQNAATAAGSNFAQELQSQRMGLQSQALKDLMGYSREIFQNQPYERMLTEKPQKQGFGESMESILPILMMMMA